MLLRSCPLPAMRSVLAGAREHTTYMGGKHRARTHRGGLIRIDTAIADKIAPDAEKSTGAEGLLRAPVGRSEQAVTEEGGERIHERHFADAQAVMHTTFVQARESCEPVERQHVHVVPARASGA